MKSYIFLLCTSLLGLGCTSHETDTSTKIEPPVISNGGEKIIFKDTAMKSFFKADMVNDGVLSASYTAPGKIAATVVASVAGASQNVVLFDNSDLASSYTALAQHQTNIHQIQQINIKQKEIELERASDLLDHGAATGRDVLEAQTALASEKSNLANEKAALMQQEADLKQGGFNPEALRRASVGKAYLICDIPENQISNIHEGAKCDITFSAYPDKTFTGIVEDVADVVDNITRMIKLRVSVSGNSALLKAGMFALASFDLKNNNANITIGKESLITVDGKDYVFVKTGDGIFERKQIHTGQQIGERLVILDGLKAGDQVVTAGAIQLKGLSFGY